MRQKYLYQTPLDEEIGCFGIVEKIKKYGENIALFIETAPKSDYKKSIQLLWTEEYCVGPIDDDTTLSNAKEKYPEYFL